MFTNSRIGGGRLNSLSTTRTSVSIPKALRILFIALFASVCNIVSADDITLSFPDDNSANNTVGAYTETWTAKIGDYSWSMSNFNNNNWSNNWTYIKCGRKNNASIASITTSFAINQPVTSVVITIDKVTASYVSSIYMQVASDKDFSTIVETVKLSDISTGDKTFNVTTPTAGYYYKLVFDCASARSNGVIQISKVVYNYKNASQCTAPTFSPVSGTKFSDELEVSISCDEGDEIYYTTDDTDPSTSTTAKDYTKTGPFTITATTTVKAVAWNSTLETSDVATATYTKVEALDGIKALKAAIKEDNSSTANTYIVKLTDAVATKGGSSEIAIEQDGEAILLYLKDHGYKEGNVFNGIATVSGLMYGDAPEITSLDGVTAEKGEVQEPSKELTLAELLNNFDNYTWAFVKLKDVTVKSISGQNITVTDDSNEIIVYKSSSSITSPSVGDNIEVKGIVYPYYKNKTTTKEFKVYASEDITLNISLTISPCGYNSLYYNSYNLALPEGLTGYVISSFDEASATLKAEETYSSTVAVPKGQAVIIKGTAGQEYTITSTDDADDAVTNLLKGSDTETELTASTDKYLYFFGYDSSNTPGFFMEVSGGQSLTCGAHKAYIELSYNAESSDAKAITLDFGTTDSINNISVNNSAESEAIYNISGMKVDGNKLQKGLYIKNGKKFIVK